MQDNCPTLHAVSFTASTRAILVADTWQQPCRAKDVCLELQVTSFKASVRGFPRGGTPLQPVWAKAGRVTRGASRRVIEAETNDHNRQGKRVALNRVLESLVRKTAPVQTVTIVDYCHGNLVQV